MSFDVGPPDGPADAARVRQMMNEEGRSFMGATGFTPEEVLNFRVHSCKPTMVSAGIHVNQVEGCSDSTTAVRHKGGWKGRDDEHMPDVYLRDSQVLSMQFQERVLKFLRAGNEVLPLIIKPLSQVGDIPAVNPPKDCVTSSSESASSADSSASLNSTEVVDIKPLMTALHTLSSGRVHRAIASTSSLSIKGCKPMRGRRALNAECFEGEDIPHLLARQEGRKHGM